MTINAIFEYTRRSDDKLYYLLAEDEHEAAEIAAQQSGGYDNLKDVRISDEQ